MSGTLKFWGIDTKAIEEAANLCENALDEAGLYGLYGGDMHDIAKKTLNSVSFPIDSYTDNIVESYFNAAKDILNEHCQGVEILCIGEGRNSALYIDYAGDTYYGKEYTGNGEIREAVMDAKAQRAADERNFRNVVEKTRKQAERDE